MSEALSSLVATLSLPIGELEALIRGVAAAPPPRDDAAIVALFGSAVSEEHRRILGHAIDRARAAIEPTPWTRERAVRLRDELYRRNLSAFLVPRADEHQGEYVPAGAERLRYSTGFTGSAGAAVFLATRAAVFVDGRYTLQAKQQVDTGTFEIQSLTDNPPLEWLKSLLNGKTDGIVAKDFRLGLDPWLHSQKEVKSIEKELGKLGAHVVLVETNPLDASWPQQPPTPVAPVLPHPTEIAGKNPDLKRHELGDELLTAKVDAALITLPDSIAWLLNIRGGDVPHTPLPLSFAVLHADGTVDLFIDRRKLTEPTRQWLGAEVRIHGREALIGVLGDLGRSELRVQIEGSSCPAILARTLEKAGATLVDGKDPCQLPKARKNATELDGIRAAHRRDGAALTRFLCWLDQNVMVRAAAGKPIKELEASDRLEAFRAESPLLRDLSFDSISGAGAHGAIVHYRATPESDAPILPGTLYLIDSGAQYPDGTTDVTRTIAIGTPTAEMADRFTRVLKGHIAVARAVFALKTSGGQLDALARLALWEVGLDYEHGTGHGVGQYLAVHEGPQNMSRRAVTTPLEAGMILSNEPGYYKTDGYGIRIENLVAVKKAEIVGGEREMLAFETLTLAPIDRRLIDATLLRADERTWVDQYHAWVNATLAPLVDAGTRAWLAMVTAPLTA